MMPVETIGLVIEKMRKMVLCAIGAEEAGVCLPSASNQPIWPRRATITVMPGRVPFSISRLNASDMRCNRREERPSDSGLAWGSDGGLRGWGVLCGGLRVHGLSRFALVVCRIGQRLLLGSGKSGAEPPG